MEPRRRPRPPERLVRHGSGGSRSLLAQRRPDTRHDGAPDRLRVAESDLGLGGMDVDVHIPRRHVDVERDHRLAVVRDQALVGAAERAVEDAVPHYPPVHEQVLRAGVGPVDGRQRR